ncbi:MAG: GNAT family N-acetyltransferase [Rhodobacter sp.]|nr:GNAT family N-acetyltransferase [Paracoccaceae bacterium]MCC0077695.1 GNAT family N-acetyltransferase [Rhodobacter sp.]
MPVTTRPESPAHPQATALLRASHAYLQSLYAAEDNHFLSIDELLASGILFFVAESDGRIVGTAALALKDGYAEVKSMFVDPAARGQGVGRALLDRLEAEGRARALPMLRLETGPLNHEAVAMYARHGYAPCGRFGDYPDSAASLFMEKPLDAPCRMSPDEDMTAVHALLVDAFAYMDGVIDPPSSLGQMTPADLAENAREAELWVIGTPPRACMILTPKGATLYLGKLAVDRGARGRGLSRQLIEHATDRARALGLPSVTLQTRVELVANQKTFETMGFVETGRTAHPGYDRPTSITYVRPVT